MNRNLVCACVLLAFGAGAGCQPSERGQAAVVEPAAVLPVSTTVTLSADQLMTLDWGGRAVERAVVVDKRVVGAGVELDIRFPGNSRDTCSMDYTSSGSAGRRALVGLDVSRYEAFALKFTLISANGHKDPNIPLEVTAGAIISPAGDGRLSACEPVVLGLSSEQSTCVATTPMRTGTIRQIGIHVHMAKPQVWDATGGIVTLRVEPAPDADILSAPQPAGDRAPRGRSAKAPATRPRPPSVQAATPEPDGQPAKVSEDEPRTKSPSTPVFGTRRIGAW